MEVILFIQKMRGLREPKVEPVGMKSYLLIRVYLDVGEEKWFERNLRKPVLLKQSVKKPPLDSSAEATQPHRKKCGLICHCKCLRQRRRQRQEYLMELQRVCEERLREYRDFFVKLEAWKLQVEKTREEIRTLRREIQELTAGEGECSVVYEDSLRKALVKPEEEIFQRTVFGKFGSEETFSERVAHIGLADIWQQEFRIAEFTGYGREFWNQQLLPERLPHHYAVLGSCRDIFPLLEFCAPGMKSLRWFLLREDRSERLLELVDAFCEEYGLVIELHILEDWKELQRQGFASQEATCVFDFSGETYFPVADLRMGSIWLDMYGSESKKLKLERRYPHITYFSLKEKWKKAQKRCNCAVFS